MSGEGAFETLDLAGIQHDPLPQLDPNHLQLQTEGSSVVAQHQMYSGQESVAPAQFGGGSGVVLQQGPMPDPMEVYQDFIDDEEDSNGDKKEQLKVIQP